MLVVNKLTLSLLHLKPAPIIDHIYIVTVNYKSSEPLGHLLSSINNLKYDISKITVIVVDSSHDFQVSIPVKFSLEIINLPVNFGFAYAANVGIKNVTIRSKERNNFIWLLNPDTILEPSSLAKALENICSDVIHGSVVTESGFDQNAIIWGAGGYINEALEVEMKYSGDKLKNVPHQPFPCDYVPGCSMLFHYSIPLRHGYLPEEYFLYFEETDWCLALKRRGIDLRIISESLIQHQSVPEKMQAPFRVYFYNRNETYFKIKNERKNSKKYQKLFRLPFEVAKLWYLNFTNRDVGLVQTFRAHLYAKVDAIKMIFGKENSDMHSISQQRLKKLMS